MKIEYQDADTEARLIITGTIFSVRKHNHLVDEILMRIPQLREESEVFLYRPPTYTDVSRMCCWRKRSQESTGTLLKLDSVTAR
ncbi:hypothetical protein GTE46_005349 [Salmonella enterica subsp. enterica]|nr:hypothetical protein [Salmonella enterica subsp. enterica]EDY2803806.1 hypothetical protein [Salmonella enterica subsp. enterica]